MSSIIKGRVGAEQVRSDFFYKPDFGLLDAALKSRQQHYDTNLATLKKAQLQAEQVNALDGYDKTRWHEIKAEYDQNVSNIKNLYNGDLTKADVELNLFTDRIGKDFGIHGEATALNNRYTSAMKNYEELKKRREEDKITEGQFTAWQRELKRTTETGIGKDSKRWNSWNSVTMTDAIIPEDFFNDFLKNKEKEYRESGYKLTRVAGKLTFTKDGHEYISYDSLLEEASRAFQNAANRTGQLREDYAHHLDVSGTKPSLEVITGTLETNMNRITQDLLDLQSLTGEKLQEKINTLGGGQVVEINGKVGPATLKYRDAFVKQLQSDLAKMEEQKNMFTQIGGNADLVKQYHYQYWADGVVKQLAHPYASAKSFDGYKVDMKITDDIYAQFALDKEKLRIQHGNDIARIQYEHNLKNPVPTHLDRTEASVDFEVPGGKSLSTLTKELEAKGEQRNTTVAGLLQQLLLSSDGGKELIKKYSSYFSVPGSLFGENPEQMMSTLLTYNEEARTVFLKELGLKESDFSNAAVVSNNGQTSLLITDATGTQRKVALPNMDVSLANSYLSTLRNIEVDRQMLLQRRDEAEKRAINNGNYTQEERRELLRYKENLPAISLGVQSFSELISKMRKDPNTNPHALSVLESGSTGGGGMVAAIPYKFDAVDLERKAMSGKLTKNDKQIITNALQYAQQTGDVASQKALSNLLQASSIVPTGIVEKFQADVNRQLSEDKVTYEVISSTSGYELFPGDPNWKMRSDQMNAYVKANLLTTPMYIGNEKNLMTLPEYFKSKNIDISQQKEILNELQLGTVMPVVSGHPNTTNPMHSAPISYRNSNGKLEQITAYIPNTSVDAPWMQKMTQSPSYVIGMRYQSGKQKGLEKFELQGTNLFDAIPQSTPEGTVFVPQPYTYSFNYSQQAGNKDRQDQRKDFVTINGISYSQEEGFKRLLDIEAKQEFTNNLMQSGVERKIVIYNGERVDNYHAIASIVDQGKAHVGKDGNIIFGSIPILQAHMALERLGVAPGIASSLLGVSPTGMTFTTKKSAGPSAYYERNNTTITYGDDNQ